MPAAHGPTSAHPRGLLFSGYDVDKAVRVACGEVRVAARGVLAAFEHAHVDEPTNPSTRFNVRLLAAEFGGTLVFVSHDRICRQVATKVIEIATRCAAVPQLRRVPLEPETAAGPPESPKPEPRGAKPRPLPSARPASPARQAPQPSYEDMKKHEADARRVRKAEGVRKKRIDELEARIAAREKEVKEIEAAMSVPGFYRIGAPSRCSTPPGLSGSRGCGPVDALQTTHEYLLTPTVWRPHNLHTDTFVLLPFRTRHPPPVRSETVFQESLIKTVLQPQGRAIPFALAVVRTITFASSPHDSRMKESALRCLSLEGFTATLSGTSARFWLAHVIAGRGDQRRFLPDLRILRRTRIGRLYNRSSRTP